MISILGDVLLILHRNYSRRDTELNYEMLTVVVQRALAMSENIFQQMLKQFPTM